MCHFFLEATQENVNGVCCCRESLEFRWEMENFTSHHYICGWFEVCSQCIWFKEMTPLDRHYREFYMWYYSPINKVCPEGIQPCTMKNRDIYWRIHKIQETLYIGQWRLCLLPSRHHGTSHSSPKCHQLPHGIFLNLISGPKSIPFQRWLQFWEKPEVVGC